jgi:hypothetical protein
MPIRPENRARYPKDWKRISHRVRFVRADGRCECEGECGRGTHRGRCPNLHGLKAYDTGKTVVLTVAHLNHTPEDCADDNLRAMCQGCHLAYDAEHHAQTAQRTRTAELEAQMAPLFEVASTGGAA